MKQSDSVTSYFFQLHLIQYACTPRFDVTGTVEFFLKSKQGLRSQQ